MRQDEIDSVALAAVELIRERVRTKGDAMYVALHLLTRIGMEVVEINGITPAVIDCIESNVAGWCDSMRKGNVSAHQLAAIAPGTQARN